MKRFLSSLFGGVSQTGCRNKARPPRRAQMEVECLETRLVPSAARAVLVFDGGDLSADEMSQGGWTGYSAQAASSFKSLFNSSRRWLDMNGDKKVNGIDANLAVQRIFAKVKEDFAPYQLEIALGNQDASQAMLTDANPGDVLVMVTGGDNTLTDQAAVGLTPTSDAGNLHDEISWVFGGRMAGFFQSGRQFVNFMANTISHEMGHAFGLKHAVIDPTNDAMTHYIMAVPSGLDGDPRDYNHDFNFQDMTYAVDGGGYQNSHHYLSATLGASSKSWMAVLKPGELTITGADTRDTIAIDVFSSKKWVVAINGVRKALDAHTPGAESPNPFDAPLGRIRLYLRGGNDWFWMHPVLTTNLIAYGGAGNDSIGGALGSDEIHGGGGDDRIWGYAGNDQLFGDDGLDHVFGGYGHDLLDGGFDATADVLWGQGNDDTFVIHRAWSSGGGGKWGPIFGGWGGSPSWVEEAETIKDFNVQGTDTLVYYDHLPVFAVF